MYLLLTPPLPHDPLPPPILLTHMVPYSKRNESAAPPLDFACTAVALAIQFEIAHLFNVLLKKALTSTVSTPL